MSFHPYTSSQQRRMFIRCIAAVVVLLTFASCKKYLDIKSDKKLAVPETLKDCQALIDNNPVMNQNFPSTEFYADNFYLNLASYNSQSLARRDAYIWKPDGNTEYEYTNWTNTYQKVLVSNQVLEALLKINPANGAEQDQWNALKGAALFFRAFSFYTAQETWGQVFNAASASTDLGIPLKLTSSVSEETPRAQVKQTYDRIIQDLKDALPFLPDNLPNSTINQMRPSKLAAYAALARIYLTINDYNNAAANANLCLQKYSTLLDYNTLNAASPYPIPKFNQEVLFYALGLHSGLLASTAKVDSNLYSSYSTGDLRKTIFFKANTGTDSATYFFRGSYDGSNSIFQFMGLSTDELYLIRAECAARNGNVAAAMTDLNALLKKRWSTGQYTDMTATDANDALTKILVERRKELLFRSLRWSDLRRLNRESRFAVTLTRNVNSQIYTLPPNDPRYAVLIPSDVLQRSSMPQNPR